MADEKMNTGQGEQLTIDPSNAPTPGQTAGDIPAPDQDSPAEPLPGDVVVDFNKINELMAERNAAARAAVEQAKDAPALTGEGDKAAEASASDKEAEDHREPWEKTQAELDEEQKKPRRGRPPKDKAGQEEKPKRKGRPPKAEKTASEQSKAQRDKVSRSKKGKSD